jgi:hypothetical protein
MKSVADLLTRSAEELRAFRAIEKAAPFDADWLDRLADRLDATRSLSPEKIEREVKAVARILADSGPLDAAPSLWLTVDALRRKGGL